MHLVVVRDGLLYGGAQRLWVWSLGRYDLGYGLIDRIYRTSRMQLGLIAGPGGTALDGIERMAHRCQLIVELGAT